MVEYTRSNIMSAFISTLTSVGLEVMQHINKEENLILVSVTIVWVWDCIGLAAWYELDMVWYENEAWEHAV